jgi:UDP-N-acetylglucosamine 2-epimerase
MASPRLILVLGARPQFIKAAPLCAALQDAGMSVRILHTGQHYDANMSGVFFEELGIPAPSWHLNCGGSAHGAMTGAMLTGIEEILLQECPDMVVVVGDTNSTLAGALAAAKLHIPVAHVEAGLRSGNRRMPEEQNRVCVDHLSDLLFCSSLRGSLQLERESITSGVFISGDIMADVFYATLQKVRAIPGLLEKFKLPEEPWIFMTLHRAASTDQPERIREVFEGVAMSGMPVVFPVHPRTCRVMAHFHITPPANVHCMDAVSYQECVALLDKSTVVLTDSGGLQKEAYWAAKPCITLRAETEWTELIETGWNILTDTEPQAIAAAIVSPPRGPQRPEVYGDGKAAGKMAQAIRGFLVKKGLE